MIESIKSKARWVCWRSIAGKKIPFAPRVPLVEAKVNDEASWGSYADAQAIASAGQVEGVGYVLGDGEAGVDLDDCRDLQTGALTPEAERNLKDLNSYSEISPSQTGVKIFVKAWLGRNHARTGLEIYGAGRYFTVTEQFIEGYPTDLQERSAELEALIEREFSETTRPRDVIGSRPPYGLHQREARQVTATNLDWSRAMVWMMLVAVFGSLMTSAMQQDQVFGIRVSPVTRTLLSEVERAYGRAVRCEGLSDSDPLFGGSEVGDDGTPIVRLNPVRGMVEEVVIHELAHLQLRTSGTPILEWQSSWDDESFKTLDRIETQIFDAIQHRAFRTVFDGSGIEPAALLKRDLEAIVKQRRFNQEGDAMGRAVVYTRIWLEFGRGSELGGLHDWYSSAGWSESVRLGGRVIDAIGDGAIRDGESQVIAFVRALNILLEGVVQFDYLGMKSRTLGTHIQTIAMLRQRK